jgi:predicted secreted protein
MNWTSALAIYVLFWVMSAFLVMPFHVKTEDEAGETLVPGQAESAPANFKPVRIAIWTTLVASTSFALYYANYTNGWLTAETFDVFR